ncbi:ribonuclease H-like domain-containing protein [Methylocystis bryophila]|uniref:YprB ribonuclease H-like domain-containing protein n=1 Tax=Methylocystis bryophila TaxID=655015 RepID=A0A1W6MZ10_9HYPH|nr:ribonuclease H-like domain-containing protein [Methylocystis bryophila]ARN82808.1 hypothetical protein B1812_18845 [Methylocystis bryophila]
MDIETTGLSRYYDALTLVGYQIGGQYHVHVAGDDPADLISALRDAATLVTFNGTLFDIPFLRKTFGEVGLPRRHVDLRYAARRIGLTGGQKAIEQQLGLDHRLGIEDLDGASAVLLWHEYLRGSKASLRKLIDYNLADIRGMCGILDRIVQEFNDIDLFFSVRAFFEQEPVRHGHAQPGAKLPDASRLGYRSVSFDTLFGNNTAATATIVGIDLTGSDKRPSGICTLKGSIAETSMVATDEEMISIVVKANPDIVSIDSPLSLPRGRIRVTDDDPGRTEYGIMRICERTLKRRGINVYPCLLPSMQRLTARGIAIASCLRKLGYPVIESYPGAAQDILGIPRKGAGKHFLQAGLAGFGISGVYQGGKATHDELDAITSALVGSFFLAGQYEALSGEEEGALIIPDLNAKHTGRVIGISGRIAAGKTTAARMLEDLGFRYVRFSQIIDDVIEKEGAVPDRKLRQETGWRLHVEKGQSWLCEQVVRRVGEADRIVVDGLRFPEDHAWFRERFAARFLHLHIEASTDLRLSRIRATLPISDLVELEAQPTETQIDALSRKGSMIIRNDGSLAALQETLTMIATGFDDREEPECQSPS